MQFDLPGNAPSHTAPKMVATDLAAIMLHTIAAATLNKKATEARPLRINGTACQTCYVVFTGWQLVETVSSVAPQGYYLLPTSHFQLQEYNGRLPYVEFGYARDAFMQKYMDTAADERTMLLYVLMLLFSAIPKPE